MEEYIVISSRLNTYSEDESKFALKVNEKIQVGYEPIGGIAVRMGSNHGAYFLQAMKLKETKKYVGGPR